MVGLRRYRDPPAGLGSGTTCTTEPVAVTIRLYFGNRRRRDLDNGIKAILDGLNGIAWADDAQVVRLLAEKHVDPMNPRAEVEIELA